MFEKMKVEKFSEQPKECLIKKLDIIYNLFSSEKLLRDEIFLENLEKIIEKIEKMKPEQIAGDSHMGHIVGQLLIQLGFIKRLRADHEKKESEFNKEDVKKRRKIIADSKRALKDYVDLCLENKDFFNSEISFMEGYWKGKEGNIADLNAVQFIEASRNYFQGKKEYEKKAA